MNITKSELLNVNHVTKSFGGIHAVKGISFTLKQGEVLGIIGPNGSGKTTLINIINGFCRPDTGAVIFKNKNITNLKVHQIANLGIARTFQKIVPFYSLSVYKNIIPPLCSKRARTIYSDKYSKYELIQQVIAKLPGDLQHINLDAPAVTLSTLQLKILELMRCILMQPHLIICDELFSGLSSSEANNFVGILAELKREGIALLMVEHRIKELFKIADHIIVLRAGEKAAEGAPKDILNQFSVKQTYFKAGDWLC